MKDIFVLIIAMLMLVPSVADAQNTHTNTFYAGYNNLKLANLKDKTAKRQDLPFNGFNVGWRHDIKPRQDIDLYVGIGAEFDWNFCHITKSQYIDYVNGAYNREDGETVNYTMELMHENTEILENWCGIKIPLDIAYEFRVKDTKLAFRPFIGIHFGTIFSAREHEVSDVGVAYWEWFSDYTSMTEENQASLKRDEWNTHVDDDSSILSGANEDYSDRAFKRFYAGWHAGVNVLYDHFSLGFSFENEMMHMNNYYKSRTLIVKLGYTL